MTKPKIINGIYVNKFFEIINAVNEKPELAKFQFRIKNTWMKGGHSRSIIKGFYGAGKEDITRTSPFIFENDLPVTLLGSNLGPAPVEYVLNALAGCLTTSIVYQAASKEILLDDVESELIGNFDLQRFLGIYSEDLDSKENIRVKIRIKGRKFSNKEKINLVELGKKSSPVFNMIANSLPITVSIEDEFSIVEV
jgi:uncharacterized OsmC-like protein